MRKLLSVLLAILTCFCFAGCDLVNKILRWGATVPPSAPPTWTYYGVVETQEEWDGLLVYVDGVGLCEIPWNDAESIVKEGDLIHIDFYNEEVEIMECYPACFSRLAESIGIVDFQFSLTWGTFGISSYDSETGRLVKTDDVKNVEDFTTTYFLTPRERLTAYTSVERLNMWSYPNKYNPTEGVGSSPNQTLILGIKLGSNSYKTIEARDVAYDDATSEQGQRFLDTCYTIADILENTEEWKALPDYPYLYD